MVPTLTAPTLTLDVSTDLHTSLRKRLQARSSAALLPGGLCLEDEMDTVTYHLPAVGGWTMEVVGDETRFTHPAGHSLVLSDCGATLVVSR